MVKGWPHLILLVLRDEVVEVGLCLCELHVVHALASVPMQKRLPTEHRRELLRHALEELLHAGLFSDVKLVQRLTRLIRFRLT